MYSVCCRTSEWFRAARRPQPADRSRASLKPARRKYVCLKSCMCCLNVLWFNVLCLKCVFCLRLLRVRLRSGFSATTSCLPGPWSTSYFARSKVPQRPGIPEENNTLEDLRRERYEEIGLTCSTCEPSGVQIQMANGMVPSIMSVRL